MKSHSYCLKRNPPPASLQTYVVTITTAEYLKNQCLTQACCQRAKRETMGKEKKKKKQRFYSLIVCKAHASPCYLTYTPSAGLKFTVPVWPVVTWPPSFDLEVRFLFSIGIGKAQQWGNVCWTLKMWSRCRAWNVDYHRWSNFKVRAQEQKKVSSLCVGKE